MYAPGRRWRPQQEPTNPSNNYFTIKKEYFIMKKVISLVLSIPDSNWLSLFRTLRAKTYIRCEMTPTSVGGE